MSKETPKPGGVDRGRLMFQAHAKRDADAKAELARLNRDVPEQRGQIEAGGADGGAEPFSS